MSDDTDASTDVWQPGDPWPAPLDEWDNQHAQGLDFDTARIFALRFEGHLVAGRFDQARAVAAAALLEYQGRQHKLDQMPLLQRLEQPLAMLKLCVRTINTLETGGIFSVGDLCSTPTCDIHALPNIGTKVIDEIGEALREAGLHREFGQAAAPAGKRHPVMPWERAYDRVCYHVFSSPEGAKLNDIVGAVELSEAYVYQLLRQAVADGAIIRNTRGHYVRAA